MADMTPDDMVAKLLVTLIRGVDPKQNPQVRLGGLHKNQDPSPPPRPPLPAIVGELDVQLFRQAERIATNRVVAGVHFPIDSAAGCSLGLTLGEYFAQRCSGAEARYRRFVPPKGGTKDWHACDFELKPYVQTTLSGEPPDPATPEVQFPGATTGETLTLDPPGTPFFPNQPPEKRLTPLSWLWRQAAREWHEVGHE